MFGINIGKVTDQRVTPVETDAPSQTAEEALSDDDLRRQLYERIAQGNALAEAEDLARRKWQGR